MKETAFATGMLLRRVCSPQPTPVTRCNSPNSE